MARVQAETILGYIGANVQRQRERRGMTQDELAAAASISTGFLRSVERGKTNVGVVALVALANALDVAPTTLFRPASMAAVKRGRPRKHPA